MASVNELINLSQYKAGDFGREGLNGKGINFSDIVSQLKTPQQKQAEQMQLSMMAAKLARLQEEQAIAQKKRELWESVGKVKDSNKTTAGITENVVDKEEAGGRDIVTVGSSKKPEADSGYEAAISKDGNMGLSAKKEAKPYDKVKVVDRAMKIIDADLATEGVDKKTMKASDYSARLKKMIPQAEIDLYGESTTPAPAVPSYTSEDNRPVNPTGMTSEPADFLPEYKEKRGMIDVAKDFYFGKKDKASGTKASGGKVMIQTPDGKRGYIPKENLTKAIARGAKLVQ